MKKLSFFTLIFMIVTSCGTQSSPQSETTALPDSLDIIEQSETEDLNLANNSKTVSKGKIESVTDIAVYSQVQEQIIKVNIKDGYTVRKGDILVELNDENLMNQLVQARNSFEQAKYMFEEILVGQGYNMDEIEKVPENILSISKVKSGYNISETSLFQAESNYAKRKVTSPISGTVTDVSIHQFDLPQSTAPLCRIFDPFNMKVVFNILESERGRVEIGSRVSVITVAYSNESHSAIVNLISPKVDENGMIRIEAKLEDCNNLIPGMTAFVNL